MTCKLVQDTTCTMCRYTVQVIVCFFVNVKEMISDRESNRTNSLFLIIILFLKQQQRQNNIKQLPPG